MAVAIDSVYSTWMHSHKDIWIAGIDSKLPCSSESAITKTGMPLYTHAPIQLNPHVTLLIFAMGINFHRTAVTRNLCSKKKASSKYMKINSL